MLDLSATATANSGTRQADAAALLENDETGVLARFRDLVADSVFSSNVSADKVVEWAAAGRVLDTRSWCVARAGGDAAQGRADFEARQGP